MAAVALLEEELTRSLATSEDDAEFEEDDELAEENADAFAANNQLQNDMMEPSEEGDDGAEDLDEEEEEAMLSDEDADGEEDEDMAESVPGIAEEDSEEDDEEDEDEDEDGEGVGAVKIAPKRLAEEDEEASISDEEDEDESVASMIDDESDSSTAAEVEEVWVPAAEEDEEEAVDLNPNRCIFCQQDEENDPNDEFEEYLACGVCGDNAHRQCAREADALNTEGVWYCPECLVNNLVPKEEGKPAKADEVAEPPEETIRRISISRDRIAGDLLPPQRGTIKPDSHSVFNQLIVPEDRMDGTRLLRKRKPSTTEEDTPVVARRPSRNKEIASSVTLAASIVEEEEDEMDVDLAENSPLTNGDKISEALVSPRASRSLRPKSSPKAGADILEKSKTSIKIVIRVNAGRLSEILTKLPKPKSKSHKKKSRPLAPASSAVTNYVPAMSYTQPFYSLHDREVDELKSKPYGGILKPEEADTSLTLPKPEHRRQFDEARQKAEEDWKARVAAAAEAAAASGIKKPRKVSGPASQIEYIEFGQHQIDIWYAAPYPEEYSRNKALFICEFCLKYMESDIVAWRHKTKCPWKHPPGDEIYRDGKIMFFEVDGRKNPLYCQNLCLLAKLFLGSKTLYYDVEPFLFYVMTEYDEMGCHFVGYFSKEKRPSSLNNVSCILVLPIHQRKGYGHLLVDFSYLLTRVERKTGSPEKPLSDMGLVTYRNYWRLVLCYYLRDFKSGDKVPSIRQLSYDTGLTPDDVVSALDALGTLIRDPETGTYAMKIRPDQYREVIRHHEVKGYATLNENALVWTPYIMGRGNASAFEHAPPMHTVAPREGDEDEEFESTTVTSGGKRDFDTMNGTNGETEAVTDSLNKLSTGPADFARMGGKPNGLYEDSSFGNKVNGFAKKLSYFDLAKDISATRFQVFPAASGSKARATPRASMSRPSPSRPKPALSSSRPRPKPRTSSSSARSRPPARPKSAARRKSGGTGRGPGRWPKGTTKKDFGNADSGPGLPPRLLKARSKLGTEVMLGDEEQGRYEEEEDDGAIVYETPAQRKRNRNVARGKPGLGKPLLGGLGKPTGKGMGKGGKGMVPFTGDDAEQEDEEMDYDPVVSGDVMDVDAEGEEEEEDD